MTTTPVTPVWTHTHGTFYSALSNGIDCRISRYDDGRWYWQASYYSDAGRQVEQSGITDDQETAKTAALAWAERGKQAILDAQLDELEDEIEVRLDRIIQLDRDRASRITAGYRCGYKDGQMRLRDKLMGVIDPADGYQPDLPAAPIDQVDIPAALRKHASEETAPC